MELISSFLGVVDPYVIYNPAELSKQLVAANIRSFTSRKQQQRTDSPVQRIQSEVGNWFTLDPLPASGRLYSPVFTFAGQVSSGATAIRLLFTHEGRHTSKELLVDDFSAGDTAFSFTVWLHRNSLFAWKNRYILQVVYDWGEVLSRRLDLDVSYERFVLGDQVLFVDPHLIPDDAEEDIVRTAKDLAWNDAYFVTYGCDPNEKKPPVLIQDIVEYKVTPACLSFSLAKTYLLLFVYRSQSSTDWLYAVDRGGLWLLRETLPLYYNYFWRLFYTLVFYDPLTDQLSTLRAWGDIQRHDLELTIEHVPTQSIDMQIHVYGGSQVQVVTRTEKMLFYLYKERDEKWNLIHPGTRFQYFRKSAGDRRSKVEDGQVYSLPVRIIAPGRGTKPTYTLDFQTNGNDIVITDGVRRIDLQKSALRASLDSTQLVNQYVDCASVVFGAYGNLFGEQYSTYSIWNPLLLLASWLPESGVRLSYNGEPQQFSPDQLFGGYMYHSLRYPNKWLQKWVNTYTLHIKNARNNDICTKQVDIVVE